MPILRFFPTDRSITVAPGTTILEAARNADILIEAPCNGAGHCGKCAVRVAIDDLPRLVIPVAHHLSPEQEADGVVLACHAQVCDDLTVHIPPRQETELRILTDGVRRHGERAPWIGKRYCHDSSVTVVHAGDEILDREPGNTSAHLYGVVVDIGTTTLAVGLVDLTTGDEIVSRSALNPQCLHGQDVLSRIKFSADAGGPEPLRAVLLDELNRLVADAADEAGIELDHIYEVVFSGNTCMLHLATGVDPAPLGRLPFTPSIRGGNHIRAADHGLKVAPEGLIWLPPIISAYVGADITAGVLAAELRTLVGVTLFIDIGTNGEMVLARDGWLTATATAAGPAFEGMNISCGMRAAAGAIEAVAIDHSGELSCTTIGDAAATGICGSGLMDLVAELVRTGVVGKSGRYVDPATLPASLGRRLEKEQGKTVFRVTDGLTFSQNDVRQVQLAKGAIRAGIDLLLQARETVAPELDRVYIAGSFGYHLSEESLLILGLLPPEASGKVTFLGNTAKSGGEMLLLNRHLRAELIEMVSNVEVVELAANPAFDRAFVEAMRF